MAKGSTARVNENDGDIYTVSIKRTWSPHGQGGPYCFHSLSPRLLMPLFAQGWEMEIKRGAWGSSLLTSSKLRYQVPPQLFICFHFTPCGAPETSCLRIMVPPTGRYSDSWGVRWTQHAGSACCFEPPARQENVTLIRKAIRLVSCMWLLAVS